MKVFVVVKIYERLLPHGGSVTSTDIVNVFSNIEEAQKSAQLILRAPSLPQQGPPNAFVVEREMAE
jgi:hypothetical protein